MVSSLVEINLHAPPSASLHSPDVSENQRKAFEEAAAKMAMAKALTIEARTAVLTDLPTPSQIEEARASINKSEQLLDEAEAMILAGHERRREPTRSRSSQRSAPRQSDPYCRL
jgi:hypothetical protein